MRLLFCLAAAGLLSACVMAEPDVRSAAWSETCKEQGERMAPFNPQTARRIEADCLRRRAGGR